LQGGEQLYGPGRCCLTSDADLVPVGAAAPMRGTIMNTQDLGRALRAIFDDRDRPSPDHRLETPQCPPLARLAELLEQGDQSGTPEERAHMAACPFCQRMKGVFRRH
jgi:hypothetical protein